MSIPVFDGHNDFLLRITDQPQRDKIWLEGDGQGQLDLPRMRKGGFAGGFFAIYVPSPRGDGPAFDMAKMMAQDSYAIPLPAPVPLEAAQAVALRQAGALFALERAAPDDFTIVRSTADIRAAMAAGRIAAIMHMEGAEAIDPDLDALYTFHAMGLRSLGPVWSRPTAFGNGVPFAFPSSPDTGDGLTDAGKRLVKACNALGIMLDLSHLNEAGFNDIAALSDAPLVATHSNAHAVTPSARNLTDRQLGLIRESGGMVGLNYATAFLNPAGKGDAGIGWDVMLRHLDHLISLLGEDHVGLGSDFDGAQVPSVLGDVAGLPAFHDAMRAHGYNDALIAKISWQNWLAVLDKTWR
ncbi:membrane dipeptidase [Ketogulonicigenium robustum]|uniref:Membrane dipeptidase n=1 Tax=Ketogulonicigenium robustum TaxID=92947 RepID=A0A1W6NWW8_9RHOB|nr:dipeptidase [Ketogulonicigenium robustum]ARO13689.1 membrane dipeptidase [Ketogulonicigenium robustum]